MICADPFLQNWPLSGTVVIFDLEITAWEGSHQRMWSEPWEFREFFQLGAVRYRVCRDGFVEEDSLDLYVRPTKNPILSDYIQNLTGITNEIIQQQGVSCAAGVRRFSEFVKPGETIYSNGLDGETVRENCLLNNIEYPFSLDQVINIKRALAAALNTTEEHAVSSDLPELVGLSVTPTCKHTALADVQAIGMAINELWRLGRLP